MTSRNLIFFVELKILEVQIDSTKEPTHEKYRNLIEPPNLQSIQVNNNEESKDAENMISQQNESKSCFEESKQCSHALESVHTFNGAHREQSAAKIVLKIDLFWFKRSICSLAFSSLFLEFAHE